MKYMFGKCFSGADGSLSIPEWAVLRWKHQMNTPYAELPESEKTSDLEEADKMLAIVDGTGICGIVYHGGRRGEPLACGLPNGHSGEHSWSTLPTFTVDGETAVEKAAEQILRNYGEFGYVTDQEYFDALDTALKFDKQQLASGTDIVLVDPRDAPEGSIV